MAYATIDIDIDEVLEQVGTKELRDEIMTRREFRAVIDDARAALFRGDAETAMRMLDDILAKQRDQYDENAAYEAAMQDKESARFVEAAS